MEKHAEHGKLVGGIAIRRYRPGDAGALARIFVKAVLATGLRAYSAAQTAAWAAKAATPEEVHARCTDGRSVFVADAAGSGAVAFIDLEEDGHIDMLFCLPEFDGRGLGAALYEELEAEAARRRIGRLYVEASEVARPFFERRGFRLVRRHDFEIDGVAMHNYDMEKALA